ncbi:MAG: diguanylate cyclase [Nitrospiraceae bacterium]|nr:diguanylate cyclase [Nitrospiraceae bacterium]
MKLETHQISISSDACGEWLGRVQFPLDLIPDPFIIIKSDGTILDLNGSGTRLIGHPRQEIIGKQYDTFEPLKKCSGKIGEAIEDNTEGFDMLRHADRDIEVFFLPFTASDGARMVRILMKDISNFKELEGELMKRNRELIIVNTLSSAFIASSDMGLAMDQLLGNILLVTDFVAGWIMVNDGTTFQLKTSKELSDKSIGLIAHGGMASLCGRIAEGRDPIHIADDEEIMAQQCIRNEGLTFLVGVPLVSDNFTTGILFLADRGTNNRALNFDFAALLTLVGNHISMILEKIRLFEETKRLSITDGLTGLYNSRYFYRQLDAEIARSDRYGDSFSIIMFDIDDFKKLNDTYGHQSGDEVLIELGKILMAASRESDIVVRYGGEEFVIILPNTSEEHTIHLADRIRNTVDNNVFLSEHGNGVHLTLSGGIASYPFNASNVRDLLHAADTAMYAAKSAGKNKVVCCRRGADA